MPAGLVLTPQLRMYRLWWFFSFLTYDMSFGILAVTLIRNLTVSSMPGITRSVPAWGEKPEASSAT